MSAGFDVTENLPYYSDYVPYIMHTLYQPRNIVRNIVKPPKEYCKHIVNFTVFLTLCLGHDMHYAPDLYKDPSDLYKDHSELYKDRVVAPAAEQV